MTNNKIKTGGLLAGAGCLVPVALSLITLLAFGRDDGNPPDWVAPFWLAGAVVMIVGLVIAIVGATERKREGLTGSVSTSADKSGSKTADVQRRANSPIKTGGILAGAGCLFGLAPLIVSVAALAVGSDIGNVLNWYSFITAPVGAVVVIVGLIIAIVGASKSTASDYAESVTSTPGQGKTAGTGTPSDAKPVELPLLPSGLARNVKIAYAFGFVVVLVSCVMRVALFQPDSGILTLFDLVPVFFAGWFVFLARNAHEGLGFLRLYQSQLVVSIAGCVVGLWPLITMAMSLSLLQYGDVDVFQLVGTAITSLIPAVASLASLIFAGVARARYRRGLKSS